MTHYMVYKCDECGEEFDFEGKVDCPYCSADLCSEKCKEKHMFREHYDRRVS